jgi:endoglucanase
MNRRNVLLGAASLAGCAAVWIQPPPPFPIRRGVNLGNALEAPNEGDWGYRIEPAHLAAIAAAGFDGVRLPVRWDAHMERAAPYQIEPAFLTRVETVVSEALAFGLSVQLDVHHYGALIDEPQREQARFVALWTQIGERFANAPDRLLFELLNEPHGSDWSGPVLASLQREAIEAIRKSNPGRLIVLGPADWQSIDALVRWRPSQTAGIVASAHYYKPHSLTHGNAEWMGSDAPDYDATWGDSDDRASIATDIARATRWAAARRMPLQIGEFGVNRAVPLQQRALWTRLVREACERHGLGWCVWDFAGMFPIWDRQTQDFIPEMREALFGSPTDSH